MSAASTSFVASSNSANTVVFTNRRLRKRLRHIETGGIMFAGCWTAVPYSLLILLALEICYGLQQNGQQTPNDDVNSSDNHSDQILGIETIDHTACHAKAVAKTGYPRWPSCSPPPDLTSDLYPITYIANHPRQHPYFIAYSHIRCYCLRSRGVEATPQWHDVQINAGLIGEAEYWTSGPPVVYMFQQDWVDW